MQQEAPDLALEWRLHTREIFETYFARGYRAVDFELQRRAWPRAIPARPSGSGFNPGTWHPGT